MPTHTITQSVQASLGQLNAGSKSYVGAAQIDFDEVIPIGGTDVPVNITFAFANIKSFVLTSDRDLTLETNSGSSPGNTIVLKPGVPYIWNTDSYDSFKLTVNVTNFFFTNGSGFAANVSLRALYDPTP